MRITQLKWSKAEGWEAASASPSLPDADLVFVFGASDALRAPDFWDSALRCFPQARFFGCSTRSEILGERIEDDVLGVTALRFKRAEAKVVHALCPSVGASADVGRALARALPHEQLKHVLVLGPGADLDGTALLAAMLRELPSGVTLTGALAAGDVQESLVIAGHEHSSRLVGVVGLYGDKLKVAHGALGGWNPTLDPQCLIDGALGAAQLCAHGLDGAKAELGLVFSSANRKKILHEMAEAELAALYRVLGPDVKLGGFYSGGTAAPISVNARCEFRDQALAVTTLCEVD